tara:strand:- start:625 stop:2406 length:1782 start_codon:yes stop_codon:yes gene_type:complete
MSLRGSRRWVVLGIATVFAVCAFALGLTPAGLIPPDAEHWSRAGKFFHAALHPAFEYQDANVPDSADPILWKAVKGLLMTLRYAVAAMSLAIPVALILGFFGSKAWWPEPCGRKTKLVLEVGFLVCRFVMSLARSIHELIWALLILSALGVSPLAGMVALAIPFAGTLGKVFSELVDEEAQEAAFALKATGHGPVQTFLLGVLPKALPNLITYSFYRFECALRASAVLGFVGIETIGLYIQLSHEEFYYREVWTYFYLLLILIVIVDRLGAAIRKRLQDPEDGGGEVESGAVFADRAQRVENLRKTRPRDSFLSWVGIGTLLSIGLAWTTGGNLLGRLSAERRWTNFQNFVAELVPAPVRDSGNWFDAIPWGWDLLMDGGGVALFTTLGIASSAIILSSALVLPVLPLASRQLARANPADIWAGRVPAWMKRLWSVLGNGTRFLFVLSRAIPEYILAYLLISLLGLQVWPLVLALAIHNFGILGRLWGEVVENADLAAAEQSLSSGAGRFQVFGVVLFPAIFSRFLIYFFYRWETCVKDATVLGMLGLLTLGKLIALSKGFFWDEMFFYVLVAASVILASDLFSSYLRQWLRR